MGQRGKNVMSTYGHVDARNFFHRSDLKFLLLLIRGYRNELNVSTCRQQLRARRPFVLRGETSPGSVPEHPSVCTPMYLSVREDFTVRIFWVLHAQEKGTMGSQFFLTWSESLRLVHVCILSPESGPNMEKQLFSFYSLNI